VRVHLIDGTYELFRAHYARRPEHVDAEGREAKATLGLVQSLLVLLDEPAEEATHLAVAFDNPIRSFRNRLLPGYKTEAGVPAELLAQFDRAEEATAALGVVVWSMDEHEADDALATGAARFREQVEQVRILTPDKDLGQCLEGERVVQVDRVRDRVIDERALRERRGIGPESIPDWLALVGDSADGIPGIPGFGEKTASALLARYRTLDSIPARARDWKVDVRGADRLAETLAERRDDALLYRRLATLVRDVPLEEKLADLRWRGAPRARFRALCEELAAPALADRPRRFV
jgi:5'-3' exonuclease